MKRKLEDWVSIRENVALMLRDAGDARGWEELRVSAESLLLQGAIDIRAVIDMGSF